MTRSIREEEGDPIEIEGREARRLRRSINRNPYPDGTPERAKWKVGYKYASKFLGRPAMRSPSARAALSPSSSGIAERADELLKRILSEDYDEHDNIDPDSRWEPVRGGSAGHRTDVFAEWKEELRRAVIRTIHRYQKDGTTGMGFDNFMQVLRVPPGAPTGTNARYYLNQAVREIVHKLPPSYQRFFLSK